MKFIRFMSGNSGRLVRGIAGLAIISAGVVLFFSGSITAGVIVTIIGLVPFLAGVFDFCIFSPLFGCPMNGVGARQCSNASTTA